jgi:two-component system chemotaxis sensor kinase CheA
MGNGDVVLILHAADLIKIAQRGERRPVREAPPTEGGPAGAGPRQKQVLVVDDSITTRTLEKNILEAAGYLVRLAIDGQEALDVIATGMPDLIIADLAMPRLDGFGLTERVKSDARTAHVPVVLVTSLDSPEDKARGIEAGADAYIVKSRFDQTNLLEMIEQLI